MEIAANVRWQTWKLGEYGDRRKESKNAGDATWAALEDRVKLFPSLPSTIQAIVQRLLLNGWTRRFGSGSSWEQMATALLATGSVPAPCWTPAEGEHVLEQIYNVPSIVYFHNTWKTAALPQGIHSNFNTWYWFVRPAYDLRFCLTFFLFSWYFPFIVIKLFFSSNSDCMCYTKMRELTDMELNYVSLCPWYNLSTASTVSMVYWHDGFIGVTQTTRYQNYIYLGNKVTTTFGAVPGK